MTPLSCLPTPDHELLNRPRPLDATITNADMWTMITTTEAWRIGWRIGLGTAVVAAPLAFVAGGLKCPADPVPCDPSEGLVHVFGTSTATGGPSIVARSLDYAAAEVVIDFKVMRWRTQVLIRPNDA